MFTLFTHNKLKQWLSLPLLAFTLSLWASQASATFLSLESSHTSSSLNQQITIDVWARDLGSDVVSGFDIDIAFDSAALSFQSAFFSPLLGNGIDSLQDTVNLGNSLNLSELSFLFESELSALQSGSDFVLASLTFVVSQVGLTQLSIVDSLVTGADPFSAAFEGSANTLSINVAAAQVPEPASIFMLLAGLFIAFGKRNLSCFARRTCHDLF